MELDSGHKCTPLSDEENAEQMKLFRGYTEGLIEINPGRWFFTSPFAKLANKYYNFKFKPTDVLVLTFPKCGTTWMQEIAWTMINNRDFNHPLASLPTNDRIPHMEFDFIIETKNIPPPTSISSFVGMFKKVCPGKKSEDGMFIQMADDSPDPRVIKTHLPFSFFKKDLLDTCKVIFVTRDPKDCCVSYHHHSRILKVHDFTGTVDQFVDLFTADRLMYSSYWTMYKEALDREDHPNLHICYFEDLKNDTKKEYRRLSKFLNLDLPEVKLDEIIEYTSFKEMKVREKLVGKEDEGEESRFNDDVVSEAGGFFRKGETGDWKAKLTPEQANKIDQWTAKNAKEINRPVKYFNAK